MKQMSAPENSPAQEKPRPLARPVLLTEQGQPFEVPAGGSLGLLALGYVGLMAWRDARRKPSDPAS